MYLMVLDLKLIKKGFLIKLLIFSSLTLFSREPLELIIGQETINPGIDLTFEAAIKDTVFPSYKYGEVSESDVHLEVISIWSVNSPKGAKEGGFVPYLNIYAEIVNQRDNHSKTIKLLPHINLTDNFHYALNTKLPGNINDLFTIIFLIESPTEGDLGIHLDWAESVGKSLTENHIFKYKNLSFERIALSSRR